MKTHAAIVLGGGMTKIKKNKQYYYLPAKLVKQRLDKAIELYKNKTVDCIVTTGNYSKRIGIDNGIEGPKTEAEVSLKYLIEKFAEDHTVKPPMDSILYENKSFDTLGNAWFTKKMCLEPNNIRKCSLITSDFHMERSQLIFRWILGDDYDLDSISLPTQFADKPKREILEKIFINYFKEWVFPEIKAGDDTAIQKYFYNEHLIYSMSERSEALFNACIETAQITAGY